ncbi:hypothetical protein ACWHAO_09830 [Streptomyces albidoflavus]
MRAVAAAGAVAIAAVLVTACGSSGRGSEGDAAPKDRAPARPLAKLNAPAAYNTAKGWDATLTWLPSKVRSIPVAVAPDSGNIALLHGTSDGYTVQARAADSGEIRWSSTPWSPPAPMEGFEGEAAEIPNVIAAEQNGREYVIAYAHGLRGKDALHEGTEVTRLAVYPADASGDGVEPLREIDVPVSARSGELRVTTDGGRLLVSWGEDGPLSKWSAAVDLVTGKVSSYEGLDVLLPQCEQALVCTERIAAQTTAGPLVAMKDGGFGVPGAWFSHAVRPSEAAGQSDFLQTWNGKVYGVSHGHVLATWDQVADRHTGADHIWSVHDATTGELRAELECGYDGGQLRRARKHPVVASPDGRYLAAGPVAFDLGQETGICLEGDGDRKTILLGSIRNDATAYGVIDDDSRNSSESAVVAQVDLNDPIDATAALGTEIDIPFVTDVKGSGVFLTRDADQHIQVSVRREQ